MGESLMADVGHRAAGPGTDRNVRASVVIPALNEEASIGRQLASLASQSAYIAEIIVVDNGSTDRTAEVARRFDTPELPVRVISEPRRGANRARNTGIAAAGGDRILLCDGDDESRPGWAAAMCELLEDHELVGGTVQLISDDPNYIPEILDPSSRPVLADFCSPISCSVALRKSMWARTGGFDPRIRRGYEEVDFFIRAQILGASIGWSHEPLLSYSVTPSAQWAVQDEHDLRLNMGRVHALAWLHGYPRRPSVLPSVLRLLVALPMAAVWPSRRNRTRVRRHWSISADRARSNLRLGLPELLRSGPALGFRRVRRA